jgi:hypothetical protein
MPTGPHDRPMGGPSRKRTDLRAQQSTPPRARARLEVLRPAARWNERIGIGGHRDPSPMLGTAPTAGYRWLQIVWVGGADLATLHRYSLLSLVQIPVARRFWPKTLCLFNYVLGVTSKTCQLLRISNYCYFSHSFLARRALRTWEQHAGPFLLGPRGQVFPPLRSQFSVLVRGDRSAFCVTVNPGYPSGQ